MPITQFRIQYAEAVISDTILTSCGALEPEVIFLLSAGFRFLAPVRELLDLEVAWLLLTRLFAKLVVVSL